jgi:prepilin-type N-terminal cleavage/methylation domain-containing protein
MLKTEKGFTLIELTIIVLIISILAMLALPRFINASTRSKQSEAQGILKQIYTLERAYFQEHGNYTDDFSVLEIEILPNTRYAYSIIINDLTFIATAYAAEPGLDSDPAPDTWTIDNRGELKCISDDTKL